ncbi:MAG: 30S ribosomal protein S6 [Bacteroidetes bacterium]|nr:30S ribosomal protein S6 [Bacteroidota bacterium]
MSSVNRYETVLILTPVLSDDQHKDTVQSYKNFLNNKGASVNYEEDWRLRKLAYPVKKKTTGYYYLLDYSGESALVSDLEVNLKRDERILRSLTVKLDKEAIAYIDQRRKEGKKLMSKQKKDKKTKTDEMLVTLPKRLVENEPISP